MYVVFYYYVVYVSLTVSSEVVSVMLSYCDIFHAQYFLLIY